MYGKDWWTPTWGSRFLVPAIPLLVVTAFPFIQDMLEKKKYGLIITVFFVGFLVQLPAVIYNSSEYSLRPMNLARNSYPGSIIWDIPMSPLISQWQIAKSSIPDLLLARISGYIPNVERWLFIYGALVLLLFGLMAFWVYRPNSLYPKAYLFFLLLSLFSIITISIFILSLAKLDPIYYNDTEYGAVCSYLKNQLPKPSNIVVVDPYQSPIWNYLINNECGQLNLVFFSNER